MGVLQETFVTGLGEDVRPQAGQIEDLPSRLRALLARANAPARCWVADDAFVRHVATHVPTDTPLTEYLDGCHAADLYLAMAAAEGVHDAVAAFHEAVDGAAATAAARVVAGDRVDELVADCMAKLLVADDGQAPAAMRYAGRGRLTKWVQTVTLRLGHSGRRKRTEEARNDIEELADRMLEAGDLELEALKRTYRRQFKAAFAEAVAALSSRQRNLLRLELLDRLTIDKTAAVYRVHAATISRWRADTRQDLLARTREFFARELAVDGDEFHSIMRLIGSRLDVSLPRLLETETDSDRR